MFVCVICAAALLSSVSFGGHWYTKTVRTRCQIGYISDTINSPFAFLDLATGNIVFNAVANSAWGTAIDTMPSYWSGSTYHDRFPVTITYDESGPDFILKVYGGSEGYRIVDTITIHPPTGTQIVADVTARLSGSMSIMKRAGEAFQPVKLVTMNYSKTVCDSSTAIVDSRNFSYPNSGWIIPPRPARVAHSFGCIGGTSVWKEKTPTVEILYHGPVQVAGWKKRSSKPDFRNVEVWAAADAAPRSWSYRIVTSQGANPRTISR
jgi:hypothetical protein